MPVETFRAGLAKGHGQGILTIFRLSRISYSWLGEDFERNDMRYPLMGLFAKLEPPLPVGLRESTQWRKNEATVFEQ